MSQVFLEASRIPVTFRRFLSVRIQAYGAFRTLLALFGRYLQLFLLAGFPAWRLSPI